MPISVQDWLWDAVMLIIIINLKYSCCFKIWWWIVFLNWNCCCMCTGWSWERLRMLEVGACGSLTQSLHHIECCPAPLGSGCEQQAVGSSQGVTQVTSQSHQWPGIPFQCRRLFPVIKDHEGTHLLPFISLTYKSRVCNDFCSFLPLD